MKKFLIIAISAFAIFVCIFADMTSAKVNVKIRGGGVRLKPAVKIRAGSTAGYKNIVFDASSTSGGLGSNTTYNFTHTISGLNTILLCQVGNSVASLTSVTANGVPMTIVESSTDGSSPAGYNYLLYAFPGAGTVSVTSTFNLSPGNSVTACTSFRGVDQKNPFDATSTLNSYASDGSNPLTNVLSSTVTTVTPNAMVLNYLYSNTAPTFSLNTGSLIYLVHDTTNIQDMGQCFKSAKGPGKYQCSFLNTQTGVNNFSVDAVALKPLINTNTGVKVRGGGR